MKRYHDYSGKDVTAVICAYRECPYLESSIQALLRQSVKPQILISTSTPNNHIRRLAEKYGIPLRINQQWEEGQVRDYNFAMAQIKTPLGILAHQDDLLDSAYMASCLEALNGEKDPILVCTDYRELHEGEPDDKSSALVRVKRILMWPLRCPGLKHTRIAKWLTQCLGNPITHSSVLCVMKKMPKEPFREAYRAAPDWDLWQRLIVAPGSFVYVPKVLLGHRMNRENVTCAYIGESGVRLEEERSIFRRFWPEWITNLLLRLYKKAQKYY